jgi:phosphoribosylformylglycinamidine cyclo-ligase
VQTNGLSLCRLIAEKLPQGYQTPIGHGDAAPTARRCWRPSVIYVKPSCASASGADSSCNYVAHVTGHGWRKLMRLEEPFVYEITAPREPLPLFKFLQEAGPIAEREMYATFNQGIGFAAYVAPENTVAVLAAAEASGYDAWLAGRVKKDGARKAVVVPSLGLEFGGDTLQVR